MEIKYDKHLEEWDDISKNKERLIKAELWFDKGTLDSWRHDRIRSLVQPIISYSNKLSWLTIGDGRFGTDANYIISMGAQTVVASDISDKLLKIANEKNFIEKYSVQNAEKISYSDDYFDCVYCKEALHHCPRAPIAFYEMLRVAKFALVLSEPNDSHRSSFSSLIRHFFFRKVTHSFESVGNYVYSINKHEIEKMMLGVGLRHYAYIGINDFYIEGIESLKVNSKSIKDLRIRLKLATILRIKNLLTLCRIKESNLLTIVVFKNNPPHQLKLEMEFIGFKFETLPENPYA